MCEEDLNDKAWQPRYHKTLDAFWNNMMFWLFICYPNVSLICMQVRQNSPALPIKEPCNT